MKKPATTKTTIKKIIFLLIIFCGLSTQKVLAQSITGISAIPPRLEVTVKPDGTENNDFIVGNDFRQVGLIKNIKDSAGSTDFTASTGIALKKLVFSAVTTAFTADATIVGGTSGARALVDKVDSSNVWYHQTDATGFSNFDSGESVSEADGSGAGTLDATYAPYVTPEVTTTTGDVLYIDNRAAVTRASDQTEDIKIVIQI